MCRWRVPWLRRKAQQGDAEEHRLQTIGQRCAGLFQQIYSSASSKGTLGVALWFRRSRFKQFEITAFAVSPRILSVYMTSTTQCFRFVVTHSPHSGQAADEVAMDSFYTELMSVTSPEPPDERAADGRRLTLWLVAFAARPSEGLGLRPSPRMAVVFENFWIGTG